MNAVHRHVREREEELQIFSPNLLQASVCALGEKGKEEEAKRNRPPSSSSRSVGRRRPQCFSWVIKTASRAGEEREKGKESEKLGGKKWGRAGRAKNKKGQVLRFQPPRKEKCRFLSLSQDERKSVQKFFFPVPDSFRFGKRGGGAKTSHSIF